MKKIMYLLLFSLTAMALSTTHLQQASAERIKDVKELIESLEVGGPVHYENLTIIPIYTTQVKDWTNYTTLEDALKNKWLNITELRGGHVPQVKLTNQSNKYIYIMGGEILAGCKQDRIIGRDVLIKPKSKNVVVPVYCVEQGRWHYQSDKFYSKDNLGTYNLRAKAQCNASSAQNEIWGEVSKMVQKLGAGSSTNAYQDIYEKGDIQRKIASFEDKMQSIPRLHKDTIGVVIGVGDKIVSVDIFANPHLFKKLWPKLLKSSALSAISSSSSGSLEQKKAIDFLRTLHDKNYTQKLAVDLGFEFSIVIMLP